MVIADCYKVLGVQEASTFQEIKAAHRKLVKLFHPDRFAINTKGRADAEERTKTINAAFDCLKSNTTKKENVMNTARSTSNGHWSGTYSWGEGASKKPASRRFRFVVKENGFWDHFDQFVKIAQVAAFGICLVVLSQKLEMSAFASQLQNTADSFRNITSNL